MKKLTLAIFITLIAHFASNAQSTASWSWGKADTDDILAGNTAPTQNVTAASGNKVLWATLQNKAFDYSTFYFGNYKLTEYDNAGIPGTSALITGKVYLSYAESDAAGNWYFLGQYYDTVNFPGGPTFVNPAPLSNTPYFLAKFNSSTLSFAWVKIIGSSTTFTIADGALYAAIDSDTVSYVSRFDLATGDRTDVIAQTFRSYTSALAVDGGGNVYLAGSCAFSGINFNGHIVPTTSVPYPVYIVKYNADGSYAWHYLMSDVTCPQRQLTLANDNVLYYSGKIFDSFTFGGFSVHRPNWVYDYLVSRLDSSGNILWVTQQKDTFEGDASADNNYHAVSMIDTSLSVFAQVRGYIDWGNGVITDEGLYAHTAVVNYSPAGLVNWVKQVKGNTVDAKNIAGNGTDIWVTGNVYDSAAYHLDAIAVPVVPVTYTPYLAKLHSYYIAAGVPEQSKKDEQAQVMPVPAANVLNIKMPSNVSGDVRIRLNDVSGRIVLEKTVNGNAPAQVDVSQYSRGLYFIDVSGSTFHTVRKIVLE